MACDVASSEVIPRKIDPNGRIVIPPEILKHLKAKPGDYVGYEIVDGQVVLHRVRIEKVRPS